MAPALYKHFDSVGNLQHRIAILALTEFGDALRHALQGKSGAKAIGALFAAVQSYIDEHPGRYSATIGARFQGPDDPLLAAATRVIDSLRAILFSYGIPPDEPPRDPYAALHDARLRSAQGQQCVSVEQRSG